MLGGGEAWFDPDGKVITLNDSFWQKRTSAPARLLPGITAARPSGNHNGYNDSGAAVEADDANQPEFEKCRINW